MYYIKCVIVLLIGVLPAVAMADFMPDTSMQHEPISSFAGETRLILSAQLKDSEGISVARCYFKVGTDEIYLYVPMEKQSGDSYQCVLPALKNGSQTMEYFFLVVNGKRQVIRSSSYTSKEGNRNVVPPAKSADIPGLLYVYSELDGVEKGNTAISDDQVELVITEDVHQLYGARVGLYEPDNIHDFLNSSPHYFGGFHLRKTGNILQPVKGFVVKGMHDTSIPESFVGKQKKSISGAFKSMTSPDITGDDWVGYFIEAGTTVKEYLTATVTVEGSWVTIETSLDSLGHYLAGEMNASGDMLIYDSYDGEDWSTHYGPATDNLIRIYDYVMLPDAWKLNEITIYRLPPPSEVEASTCVDDKIVVSWNASPDAGSYNVYACKGSATDDCTLLSNVTTLEYEDAPEGAGSVTYRVKACNKYGCGGFSDSDTEYCSLDITPWLQRLLLSHEGVSSPE